MSSSVEFNDRRGQRGRAHINLIAARLPNGQQVIFEFTGKNVPGVLTVVSKHFTKEGKWSANYWTVELAEGVIGFTHSQCWGSGEWLDSGCWRETVQEISWGTRHLSAVYKTVELDADAVERFVRSTWPDQAKRLDAAEADRAAEPSAALVTLLAAQEELAQAQKSHAAILADVARLEEAETIKAEAAALRERTARAREAMKRGIGLADLKELLC